MEEAISRELFDHLVHLAQLDMTPEEAEYLRRELNRQLEAVRKLEAIPLQEDVPITAHGIPYLPQDRPALREDQPQTFPEARRLVELAPDAREGYFVVPDTRRTQALT